MAGLAFLLGRGAYRTSRRLTFPPTPREPERILRRAYTRRIYDGDTIWADVEVGYGLLDRGSEGRGVSHRLLGIDTPELKREERPQGLIVREVLELLLPIGEAFWIETPGYRKDSFGRYLSFVWPPFDLGVSLNEWLLVNGFAVPYSP